MKPVNPGEVWRRNLLVTANCAYRSHSIHTPNSPLPFTARPVCSYYRLLVLVHALARGRTTYALPKGNIFPGRVEDTPHSNASLLLVLGDVYVSHRDLRTSRGGRHLGGGGCHILAHVLAGRAATDQGLKVARLWHDRAEGGDDFEATVEHGGEEGHLHRDGDEEPGEDERTKGGRQDGWSVRVSGLHRAQG